MFHNVGGVVEKTPAVDSRDDGRMRRTIIFAALLLTVVPFAMYVLAKLVASGAIPLN